ncbi:CPBP family intramembrane glutamic endopeptidase [Coriobacterium glomerans]|nr:CPBP family intramembrane glutamic endopeptidase [Coriobacterium glomerans]
MSRPIIRFRWLAACLGIVAVFTAIQYAVSFIAALLLSFWLAAALVLMRGAVTTDFDPSRLMPLILLLCDAVSLAIGVAWYRILRGRERAGLLGAVFSRPPSRWLSGDSGCGPAERIPKAACVSAVESQTLASRSVDVPAPARRCARTPPALATWRAALGAIGLGLGLQLLSSGILGLMMSMFPAAGRDYSEMMENSGIESFSALVLASVVIVGPIVEETIYRGIVFMFARRASTSFWVANTIQAACFGIAHLNILQGTYAFVIGIVLGLLYERTGRLWVNIVCHAAVNLLSYAPVVLGASVSLIGLLGAGALCVAVFGLIADLWGCRPSRLP